MSPRASSRDALLSAAEAVVREHGATHLTLDAVSARANVSKGGLLYHFCTKEALLVAMLNRLNDLVTAARTTECAKLPKTPARELKAHVHAMGVLREQDIQGIAAALLAAGAENPKLLTPVRTSRTKFIAGLSRSGLSIEFVSIVSFALEGLLLAELLEGRRHSRKEYQAIIRELLRLIDEEESRSSG